LVGVGDLECEGGCREGHEGEALSEIHDGNLWRVLVMEVDGKGSRICGMYLSSL
jgi:hypothetical protein